MSEQSKDKAANASRGEAVAGEAAAADAVEDIALLLQRQFERNLAALQEFMPELHERFKGYRPSRSLEFFTDESGCLNLRYGDSGEALYPFTDPKSWCDLQIERALQDAKIELPEISVVPDPLGQIACRYKEEIQDITGTAENLEVKALPAGLIPNCLFYGVGLGYALGSLYERIEVAHLILIEPDPDLFFASLHTFDWDPLLHFLKGNGSFIKVIVSADPHEIYWELREYYRVQGNFLSTTRCEIVHDLSKQVVDLVLAVNREYPKLYSGLGFFDDLLFGMSHGFAAVRHKCGFVRETPLPSDLAATPVFVIANGPSLDEDLDFIRANQDKALIIACGTALDTLYHCGIQPDFYACTERVPDIAETVAAIPDKDFLGRIVLLASEVVHPRVAAQFKHTMFFIKDGEIFDVLLSAEALKRLSFMNPLVGNLGLSAVLTLGFKELVLLGLDCGIKQGTDKHHSTGSQFYYGKSAAIPFKQNLSLDSTVHGNFGGYCESARVYMVGILNLEAAIRAAGDGVRCLNASDGARIEGAQPKHSADIDLSCYPELDKDKLRSRLLEALTCTVELPLFADHRWCRHREFYALIERLSQMWESVPSDRLDCLAQMRLSIACLNALERSELAFMAKLLRGSVEMFFIAMQKGLFMAESKEQAFDRLREQARKLRYFLLDAAKLYEHAPNYPAGEHQKLLQGRVGWDHPGSSTPPMPELRKLMKEGYQDPQQRFVKLTGSGCRNLGTNAE